MSSASIKKIIPCKKNQLIEMVLDIEKYPEFVPWCLDGKIHTRKESSDLVEIKADLKVGKSIINETYTSLVHYYKEKDKILVTNIEGPLTHLKNEWKFKEINNSTQLEFDIDFELKRLTHEDYHLLPTVPTNPLVSKEIELTEHVDSSSPLLVKV